MFTTAHILRLAGDYGKFQRLALSTVGKYAAGDGKFFIRLQSGKTCTVRRQERVTRWFDENWPDGLAWPADIARPSSHEPEERGAA